MEQVTLAEAKENLDELMQRAARGEDVRIADPKLGTVKLQPVAMDVATATRVMNTVPLFEPLKQNRVPGRLSGVMQVPTRLMEPMSDDELRDWYGDDL